MESRKQEILNSIQGLEAVLNEAPKAERFKKTVDSIKKKLEAEKERYLSMFKDTEDRVKVPSMGVIEMVSEKSEDAQYYFGSPIKARDHVRIRVYQASLNPKTEEIFPEELISEVVMTEKQLGDILSQPGRGTGFPVTQVVRDGETVEPYDAKSDPGKSDMNRLHQGLGNDEAIRNALKAAREKVAEAKEQGRMKKKDGTELARSLRNFAGNIPSNAKYRVDRVTEAYSERVSESALVMHLDVRSEQARIAYKKDED